MKIIFIANDELSRIVQDVQILITSQIEFFPTDRKR